MAIDYGQLMDAVQIAVANLNPEDRARALDTTWRIQPSPTPDQLADLGPYGRPDMYPLGIYQNRAGWGGVPTITVYSDSIAYWGYPLQEVVQHELQHRLGFDHSLDHMNHVLVARPQQTPGWPSNCPVCRLVAKLAEAERLAAGLVIALRQQGHIPAGLGGTIPLIKQTLLEARSMMGEVASMMPDRQGEVRSLLGSIGRAVQAYDGLVPAAALDEAAGQAWEAWWQGYQLAWGYFAARRP